jgi:hypothetical protein
MSIFSQALELGGRSSAEVAADAVRLAAGRGGVRLASRGAELRVGGRGLHSSTFQLNLSALNGIGGARRGCVARVKGVFRMCRVFSCVRNGSS